MADLAEVEQAFVERGPVRHPTAVDVVGEMVDVREADALRRTRRAGQPLEVDVVDARPFSVTIDEIERRAPDRADRRQAQLHRAGRQVDRLGAEFERTRISMLGIGDTERHAASPRPVLLGEESCLAVPFAVDDEVDAALPVERHILRAVFGHGLEAELQEERLERAAVRPSEFDELEAVEPHRVRRRSGVGGGGGGGGSAWRAHDRSIVSDETNRPVE